MLVRIFLVVTGACLFLSGCHMITNPYGQMTSQQLVTVSDGSLCKVIRSKMYVESTNVYQEASRRGLTDCSKGEVYCRSLGLQVGTHDYADCRFAFNQQELQQQALAQQQAIANRQLNLQEQKQNQQALADMMASMPTTPTNTSMHCRTRYSGDIAYTDC